MKHHISLRHLVTLLFLSVAILFLHVAASRFYWYDAIFYFDKIMHFLGGLWWGYFFLFFRRDQSAKSRFVHTIVAVFVIGIFWELYEYGYQAYYRTDGIASPLDSLDDIFFDTLGGVVAVCSIHLKRFFK